MTILVLFLNTNTFRDLFCSLALLVPLGEGAQGQVNYRLVKGSGMTGSSALSELIIYHVSYGQ